MRVNKFSTRQLPNIESSLSFDGVGQFNVVPFGQGGEKVAFSNTDSWHVSFFIKYVGVVDTSFIMSNRDAFGDGIGWGLSLDSITSKFKLDLRNVTAFIPGGLSTQTAITPDNWYHVGINIQGGGGSNTIVTFFLNGFNQGPAIGIAPDFTSINDFEFGSAPATGAGFAKCEIAYLRFFSRILTDDEVFWNCNNPGDINESLRDSCILDLSLQNKTIGNEHKFKEALSTTGGTEEVTSSDNIPLKFHPFSICAFTNLD